MINGIIILVISILITNNLYGMTNEEISKLQTEYLDDSNKTIEPLIYDSNNIKFETKYIKKDYIEELEDEQGFKIPAHNTITGYILMKNKAYQLFENNYVFVMGQDVIQVSCSQQDKVVLLLMLQHINEGTDFGEIEYEPYFYEVTEKGFTDVTNKYKDVLGSGAISFNVNYTPRYPYYSYETILKRLYETNVCTKQ